MCVHSRKLVVHVIVCMGHIVCGSACVYRPTVSCYFFSLFSIKIKKKKERKKLFFKIHMSTHITLTWLHDKKQQKNIVQFCAVAAVAAFFRSIRIFNTREKKEFPATEVSLNSSSVIW